MAEFRPTGQEPVSSAWLEGCPQDSPFLSSNQRSLSFSLGATGNSQRLKQRVG